MFGHFTQLTSKHTLRHQGSWVRATLGHSLCCDLIRWWCYTSDARNNFHFGSGLHFQLVEYKLNDNIIFESKDLSYCKGVESYAARCPPHLSYCLLGIPSTLRCSWGCSSPAGRGGVSVYAVIQLASSAAHTGTLPASKRNGNMVPAQHLSGWAAVPLYSAYSILSARKLRLRENLHWVISMSELLRL